MDDRRPGQTAAEMWKPSNSETTFLACEWTNRMSALINWYTQTHGHVLNWKLSRNVGKRSTNRGTSMCRNVSHLFVTMSQSTPTSLPSPTTIRRRLDGIPSQFSRFLSVSQCKQPNTFIVIFAASLQINSVIIMKQMAKSKMQNLLCSLIAFCNNLCDYK